MNYERKRKLFIVYKIVAEQYLINMLSLKRLDERFYECKIGFETIKTDVSEKNNGLRFISLINNPHIERLDEDENNVLNMICDGNTEDLDIQGFIEKTYQKVLAGDIGENRKYEYYKSIYGNGILPANSIVFSFRDKNVYNSDGSMDWNIMKKKTMLFFNVKQQFEKLAKEKISVPVYLVRL